MTTLIIQGQRIAKLEQGLDDHQTECEKAQAATLKALETLAGEVRALKADINGLMALKNQGIGMVVAMSLFGALIIMGVIAFIRAVVK